LAHLDSIVVGMGPVSTAGCEHVYVFKGLRFFYEHRLQEDT